MTLDAAVAEATAYMHATGSTPYRAVKTVFDRLTAEGSPNVDDDAWMLALIRRVTDARRDTV